MKRKNSLIIALLVLVLIIGSSFAAFAASVEDVKAQVRPDFTIVIDGVTQSFYNAQGAAVYPLVYDGTTYLPVRAVSEIMGKNTNWDEVSKTITLSGTKTGKTKGKDSEEPAVHKVSAQVRPDFTIVIDGTERTFYDVNDRRVYPLLSDGSTYLPVRAIGEIMGKSVSWSNNSKTVTLGSSETTVTDADSFNGAGAVLPDSGDYIGKAKAKELALKHAGVSASKATFTEVELRKSNSKVIYSVEFYTAKKEYDYEINALTGEILDWDHDIDGHTPATGDKYIGIEKAKDIALKEAGNSKAAVTKCKLDHDDGRAVYEVELREGKTEYEFEIDALTGDILEWDVDFD